MRIIAFPPHGVVFFSFDTAIMTVPQVQQSMEEARASIDATVKTLNDSLRGLNRDVHISLNCYHGS